jgi:hypothetical protein
MRDQVLIEQQYEGHRFLPFAYVITKPSTLKQAISLMDIRPAMEGYSYKIVTIESAMKMDRLIGKEYLKDHVAADLG